MRSSSIGLILSLTGLIFYRCGSGDDSNISYYRDIRPILQKSCSDCHHPQGAAPFSLLTYEDAVKHAPTIKATVTSRFMPPWPADPEYNHFIGERFLSDEEIRIISQWVETGTPEGNRSEATVEANSVPGPKWGQQDLTVRIPDRFPLPGDNQDRFMMMKVPIELPADTFVRLIEIVPDNRRLVHHINGHLVQYAEGSKQDIRRGMTPVNTELHDKLEAFRMLDLPNDDGTYPMLTPSVTNYLPGVEPVAYPKGIGGYRLKKKSVLLLDNIHYGPTPIDTSDQTAFRFYFMPEAPVRPTHEFIMGTSGISPIVPPLVIQPGQVQTFFTRYTLEEKISLLTINPHMHLLGKSFKAYALKPSGDTIRLIRIPKWDFRWQYFYTFPKPIVLEAGTTLVAEGVYDNTENNPLNPFHPPQRVAEREGSMRTTDEMFQLICTYIPYQAGDENIDLDLNNQTP